MTPQQIKKGRSYVNASGRTERKVLEVGADVPFDWFGEPTNRPLKGGVKYLHVRTGKTIYATPRLESVSLESFAKWARRELHPDEVTE